jgi:hypothetical protein
MPHEAIVEIIGGVAEMGLEAATTSKDGKSGCGCLILTIIVVGLLVAAYYYL